MQHQPLYQDSAAPVQDRVDDLLGRMTLEEKSAQLGSAWIYELQNDDQSLAPEKLQVRLGDGLGQITRLAGGSVMEPVQVAETANAIQRYLREETRLGIPAMIHDECCVGLLARNATNFPQIIGLASTWEPALAEAMTGFIRGQMRAAGIHQGLAPVLDICRDPRWGRIEETFGEDPYLTAAMGVAYVRGLQGDSLAQGVVATGKHFIGYSAPEGGLNWAPAHLPPRELHEVYLHPFEAAVRQAGLASMMNAYQELDGIPCAMSRELLTTLLREEWGFDGLVVSDYMAINQLADYHKLAQDKAHAARLTLEAGMDVELPNMDCFGTPLVEAVQAGAISMALVDQAVRRVLTMKIRLGLFEHPYVETGAVEAVYADPAPRELAGAIAARSMVLLKNDGLLPLEPALRSVAVIGPNAHSKRNLLGDYSYPAHIETLVTFKDLGFSEHPLPDSIALVDNYADVTTVLEALQLKLGDDAAIHYAKGCDVSRSAGDHAPLSDEEQNGIQAAVQAAKEADVAIVVVGDKSGLTPDCTTGEFRDRATLGLPGLQQTLVDAVLETGTPTVVVLVNGRPYAIPEIAARAPAILEAWLPGDTGGKAIVDVLFGDTNPGGKLPVTIPRSVGQVPLFYGHRPSGARSFFYGPYVDESNEPLYPFGFGLSYTTFSMENLTVTPEAVAPDETVQVAVEVVNTGERAGDQVVQLYTRTEGATVTRPVKELRGFRRVHLTPGARVRVTFELEPALLSYLDGAMERVVEPSTVEVMVGSSSADIHATGCFTITGARRLVESDRPFFSRVTVDEVA